MSKTLPIVILTIGNHKIRALIDTGSTTSLLDESRLDDYERRPLDSPLTFASLNGRTNITEEIITELPLEFGEDATMSWKLTKFQGKDFDAILGQNLLKPLGAVVDMDNESLRINGNSIEFLKIFPYFQHEICQLETVNIDSKVLENLYSGLNSEEAENLQNILDTYIDLIYTEGQTLSNTDVIEHEIRTVNERPVYAKMYRYPHIHEHEINRQIDDMLKQGIIRESNSPYNSPLWIVPKKVDNSGERKWRVVIDYRKLNEITVDDKFPIPNIEDILDKLGRAQYFTTIDLAKGFHQILVKEEDRLKTAFSTPYGHYEYIRMPFGLKNAPATFQRLINKVLYGLINRVCVVYMDDILVFSTSMQEHVSNIRMVFDRLREARLRIQINKCNFFSKETLYLGHILTPGGVRPNPAKVDVILNLSLPKTVKGIKSFLGMTGYYRKFIRDYSRVVYPMIRYLKKGVKLDINDPNYINAFEKMKAIITEAPVLKYPDFRRPFQLITDASSISLGAVLQQDGHPISFASRTLNDHERNYSATEKELLAIVWATTYYRPYLYGVKFEILSDHQPLRWLFVKSQSRDLNPRLYRWMVKLSEFNVIVNYIRGKDNLVADFLSRMDNASAEINVFNSTDTDSLYNNIESQIDTVHSQEEEGNDHIPILDTVVNRFKTQIILTDEKTKDIDIKHGNRKIYINSYDLEHGLDDILRRNIEKGRIGIYTGLDDHKYNVLQQKVIEMFEGNSGIRFVRCSYHAADVPTEDEAYRQIHQYHRNETGHTGITENYEGLKRIIYFPNLKVLVQKYVNNCDICNSAKFDRNPVRPKFQLTETPTDVKQLVHMDIYTNSKSNFLTFIDRFSKFATAFYLEDRTNQTIIEKLRLYKSQRGHFDKLITDNEFKSVNIKEYLRNENIVLHLAKPNSHTGNSDIERLHNTISEKIRIMTSENITLSIKDKISKAIEFYNSSYHSVTKERPFDVEYGHCDKKKVHDYILRFKQNSLNKRNLERESYVDARDMGFIKNYRAVRHKEQPKFRLNELRNVHCSNIQRRKKYDGIVNVRQYDN